MWESSKYILPVYPLNIFKKSKYFYLHRHWVTGTKYLVTTPLSWNEDYCIEHVFSSCTHKVSFWVSFTLQSLALGSSTGEYLKFHNFFYEKEFSNRCKVDMDCPRCTGGGYVFGFYCIGGTTKFPETYYIPGKCICRPNYYCDIKSMYITFVQTFWVTLYS